MVKHSTSDAEKPSLKQLNSKKTHLFYVRVFYDFNASNQCLESRTFCCIYRLYYLYPAHVLPSLSVCLLTDRLRLLSVLKLNSGK